MQTQHFDYIVIGGGSGGYAAARTARESVQRVAIIDSADTLGGLCILRGCMPSKALLYSGQLLYDAKQATSFGLKIPAAVIDMPTLQKRKQALVKEFAHYRGEQLQSNRFTLFRNKAKFIDKDKVQLGNGQILSADHFMVATGSVVATPNVPGLAESNCWTSDHLLNLDFVPKEVVVLGGGVVACELAQFLTRIGTKVTLIQRSNHLLKGLSSKASAVIKNKFREEGIVLYTGTSLQSVNTVNGQYEVIFEHESESLSIQTPHLLNALGRKPATQGLDLSKAGISTSKNGQIICNKFQQTTNPKVYASGDVTGPHEIVHVAILQGEAAAKHATGRVADPVSYDSLVSVVFTDPQVAQVGPSKQQLDDLGAKYLSADYPFDDHGKSMLMNAKHGYVEVYCDLSGKILGAQCVGKDAGELIHSMAVAASLKATVHDLLKVQWYHPTLSEIWTYPLEDLADAL